MIASWKTPLTQLDTTAQELLGAIRYEDNAVYKYVKFSGTLALVANDFVCYVVSDLTNTTVDGTNSVLGAGMALASHSGTGSAYYGWIQIRGTVTLSTALTAGADGDALTVIGAGNKTLDVSALVTDVIYAIAVDASAKIVNLTCPN